MPTAKRLLLADDQRDVLTALELLFKAEGISAATVTSPDAIVAAVERESFDAVLMDLNYTRDTTSGEEGLDVLTRLASIPGAPPVIVMTAWGSIGLAVEAMRRGARDFVTKPWDNRELLATVEKNTREEPPRYARNELEVASQVQHKLWPAEALALSSLAVSGHCRPAGAVGGDTFDFIPLGEGLLALSLADVSGKGLPAALLMASLQAILRSGVSHGASDLAGFLEVANRHFFESTEPHHYATLFFAVYDEASRMLRYASCGHPPAILVAEGDSVRKLGATAAAFGMFQDLAPEVRSVALRPGDALLLYSDGLPEAQSSQGEELGESGLLAVVLELLEEETLAASAFPRRVIDDIIEGRGFQQRDDMTLVLLRGL
jgi:sigma-B regulation protein RsbU (phosphoserine phosphatase)